MKTIYSSVLFLLLAVLQADAQTFQRLYTNDFSSAAEVGWSEFDQTFITVTLSINSGNVQVIKTSATGVPVWHMSYALGLAANSEPDIRVSSDGTIFIAGSAYVAGGTHYYILTLFAWGQVWWAKEYVPQNPSMGYDTPALTILPDGNLMLTESVYGHLGYIKLNPAGVVLYSDIYREDPGVENKTPGFASDIFPDGSMIFTGKRNSDIVIMKTDANGAIQWSRVMNAPNPNPWDTVNGSYYHTKDILALSDGSSLACGYENAYAFVLRMSAAGTLMWYQRLNAPQAALFGSCFYDIEQLDANTFVMAGMVDNPLLAKIDINGNLLSMVETSDPMNYFQSRNVTLNTSGQLAWPLSYSQSLVLNIMNDVAVTGCKMADAAWSFQQTDVQWPVPLTVPVFRLSQTVTENALPVTGTPLQIAYDDDWCSVVAVEEQAADGTQLAIRNTLLDQSTPLCFSLGEYVGEITYTVHDMNGRIITNASEELNAGEVVSSNAQTFAAGLYVLTVQAGEKVFTEKFVVRE